MQSLEVISINIWSIIISLCNLVILFWILKKFLYRPVRSMIARRQAEIDAQYAAAADAEREAEAARDGYAKQLSRAREDAEDILRRAAASAEERGGQILRDAKERAGSIVLQARDEAEQERRRADEAIRREFVGVSAALAEKLLAREVNPEDHRSLIDSFIEELGDGDD